MTRLRFVGKSIMRRIYRDGLPAFYYQVITNGLNTATGAPSRGYNVIPLRRALFLPVDRTRGFDYDLSYIAANKNFTFGGLFDREAFVMVLNTKDMRGVKPTLNDFLIFSQDYYEVKAVGYYPDDQLLVVGLEGVRSKESQKYVYAETKLASEVEAT